MYVTAHLVRSRSGEEGINAFLHLHGAGFVWPPDAAALADTTPGKVVRSHIDLQPGFNLVQAYLDVLAPDGTPREELDQAIAVFSRNLAGCRNPTVFVLGRVTIRFGVELRRERLRALDLEMLRSVAWSQLGEGT
ncbi:MAG TPA: hypothetical protein VFK02_30410 [Kofleriaceae bacterium]|nr:hypothetical protein [Kofleriaceae bacterium]